MSGALVKRAEGLLAGLGDEAHDVTRQVFLRLVTFGEGADDTRRRVLQSELEQLDVDREMLRAVLDTFGRHRLLSFDRDPVTRSPTVEISHEALLTEWTRLRDWIDGARDDVRNQRRLAEAMREWVAADRAETYLLRGGLLEQMHGWATTTSLPAVRPGASLPRRQRRRARPGGRGGTRAGAARRRGRTPRAATRPPTRRRRSRGRPRGRASPCSARCNGVRRVDAKDDVDDLLTVADLVAASEAALVDDPELRCCSPCSRCARPSTSGSRPRKPSTRCTSRSTSSACSTTSVATPLSPSDRGPAASSACMPCRRTSWWSSPNPRSNDPHRCGVRSVPLQARARRRSRSQRTSRSRRVSTRTARPMPARALAGTTITIAAPDLAEDAGFAHELEAFTERTGIAVELDASRARGSADAMGRRPRPPRHRGFGGGSRRGRSRGDRHQPVRRP